jgi:cobalt-zinc-cadmium resistance protein CzcA
MRLRLAKIPGVSILMSQPIQGRVDELISGVRTEVSIKIFGDDLEILRTNAEQTAKIMKTVRGVQDIKVEQIAGQPYLNVAIDRRKIARHGLNVSDVQDVIASAVGGKAATYLYEDVRRFELILRLPEAQRNNVQAIQDIVIRDSSGVAIPLSDLATVDVHDGPVHISREHAQRRIFIGFNVEGRDIGSVVAEGQRKLAEHVHLPDGYRIVWSGAFENMQRAMARLQLIVPVTIVIIFFLLFSTFGSVRAAALVLMNLPLALIGGVVALWLTGQYLSVPASIGFIALFGVAVLNGIVLVSYINQLRGEGQTKEEAVINGCRMRLRPVLMTALVALLGLLPMAFAQGIGAEVQRPLATVVIGGLVSSTFLTLIVLPVAYLWFGASEETGAIVPQERSTCDDQEPVRTT